MPTALLLVSSSADLNARVAAAVVEGDPSPRCSPSSVPHGRGQYRVAPHLGAEGREDPFTFPLCLLPESHPLEEVVRTEPGNRPPRPSSHSFIDPGQPKVRSVFPGPALPCGGGQ